MSLAASPLSGADLLKTRLARAINSSAGLLLGVWSPDGGGKAAAGVLAVVTVLATAASTQLPHLPVTPAEGARMAQAHGLRPQPVNYSLLAPASVAQAPLVYQQMSPQEAVVANAAVAFSSLPNPAARAFQFAAAAPEDHARALGCLTMAVYYEAASENADGQAAVAQVVLNRLRHPLFPKTVCGVVFEGSKLRTGCQFSFTCDGSLARRPSQAGWLRARQIAQRALGGYVLKAVGEATHYHTMWVVPYWQPSVVKLTQIGAHIFYRWQGEAGMPGAFRHDYAGVEEQPPLIPGFVEDPAAPIALAGPAAPAAPASPAPAKPAVLIAAADPRTTPPVVISDAPPPLPPVRTSFFGDSRPTGSRLPIASGW